MYGSTEESLPLRPRVGLIFSKDQGQHLNVGTYQQKQITALSKNEVLPLSEKLGTQKIDSTKKQSC